MFHPRTAPCNGCTKQTTTGDSCITQENNRTRTRQRTVEPDAFACLRAYPAEARDNPEHRRRGGADAIGNVEGIARTPFITASRIALATAGIGRTQQVRANTAARASAVEEHPHGEAAATYLIGNNDMHIP